MTEAPPDPRAAIRQATPLPSTPGSASGDRAGSLAQTTWARALLMSPTKTSRTYLREANETVDTGLSRERGKHTDFLRSTIDVRPDATYGDAALVMAARSSPI